MKPDEILAHARNLIEEYADGDPDRWWYANRFVFARLMLDERKTKTAIKKHLLSQSQPCCYFCGKPFAEKKGIHLHRLDETKGYSHGNCGLAHRECHQEHHRKTGETAKVIRPAKAQPDARGILTKHSKRYDGSFLYWWDITPPLAEALDRYEAMEFLCDDTKSSCLVPVSTVKPLLTPERQTSRGAGNWGVKVRKDHEDELGFEPGKSKGDWIYVPITWIEQEPDD